MTEQDGELTQILEDAHAGNKDAVDRLWSLVLGEIRQMAAAKLRRERQSATMQTTMLMNEVYLRLVDKDGIIPRWDNSKHFYGSVARTMTQFLVDLARKRDSLKRGGDRQRMPFDISVGELVSLESFDLDSLSGANAAFGRFQQEFTRQGEVAYYRWCSGFNIEETAAALEISESRVSKDWRFAQAWLLRELSGEENSE
jgi:RNA polymerase sigma factor (TIGR02999 family)